MVAARPQCRSALCRWQVLNIDGELADIDNLKMWLASLSEELHAAAERKKLASLEDGVETQRAKVCPCPCPYSCPCPCPPHPAHLQSGHMCSGQVAEYESKIDGVKGDMEAARSLSEGAASEKAELDRQCKDANKRLASLKGKRHALQVASGPDYCPRRHAPCVACPFPCSHSPSHPVKYLPPASLLLTPEQGQQLEGQHHGIQEKVAD